MFLGRKPSSYWKNELSLLLDQIHDSADAVTEQSELMMIPSSARMKIIFGVIEAYLIKNDLPIYGGNAQDAAVRKASRKKDWIYNKPWLHDIEFYSSQPRIDAVSLCDWLMQSDEILEDEKREIQALDARHEDTLKISVDYIIYCDISYVPSWILDQVETFTTKNGLVCVHPYFSAIDFLRILTNKQAAFKWQTSIKRFYKLQKYYPFVLSYEKSAALSVESVSKGYLGKMNGSMREITKGMIDGLQTSFWKELTVASTCILTGFATYRLLVKFVTKNDSGFKEILYNSKYTITDIEVPFVEILTIDYAGTLDRVDTFLRGILSESDNGKKKSVGASFMQGVGNKDGKKEYDLRKEKYLPFFQFFPQMTVIYLSSQKQKDYPICVIYNYNGHTLPIVTLAKNSIGINYSSFQFTLMFFLVQKFRCNFNKGDVKKAGIIFKMFNKSNYANLVSNMLVIRKLYLKRKGLEPVNDKPIISDFILNSIGVSFDFIKESYYRRKENPRGRFWYNPKAGIEGPKRRWPYSDISGNMVVPGKRGGHYSDKHDKDKKIKKEKKNRKGSGSDSDSESVTATDTDTSISDNEIDTNIDTDDATVSDQDTA